MKKAQSIREITYDIQDPMVVLWNEIDDLTRLAEAANNPYTPRQILEFGETILLKCPDFEGDMKKCTPSHRMNRPGQTLNYSVTQPMKQ